jgi:hypothetical protein
MAETAKLEAVRPVADEGAMHMAEDVGLAAAGGAGTGAAEFLEADIALKSVIPDDCEFVADDFDADRMKWHGLGHK